MFIIDIDCTESTFNMIFDDFMDDEFLAYDHKPYRIFFFNLSDVWRFLVRYANDVYILNCFSPKSVVINGKVCSSFDECENAYFFPNK